MASVVGRRQQQIFWSVARAQLAGATDACRLGVGIAAWLAVIPLLLAPASAQAPWPPASVEPAPPELDPGIPIRPDRHSEVWSGVDVSDDTWSIYSGGTFSPFVDIHAPGLKLRANAGYGRYRFRYFNNNNVDGIQTSAKTYFADALIGYLWRWGPLTTKLFVGVAAVDHQAARTEYADSLAVAGNAFGVKGVAEFWLNTSDTSYLSLDLSWSSANDTSSARLRQGFQVFDDVYAGVEGGFFRDDASYCAEGNVAAACTHLDDRDAFLNLAETSGRVGVFVRKAWDGGEISASFGVQNRLDIRSNNNLPTLKEAHRDQDFYGTLSTVVQF